MLPLFIVLIATVAIFTTLILMKMFGVPGRRKRIEKKEE